MHSLHHLLVYFGTGKCHYPISIEIANIFGGTQINVVRAMWHVMWQPEFLSHLLFMSRGCVTVTWLSWETKQSVLWVNKSADLKKIFLMCHNQVMTWSCHLWVTDGTRTCEIYWSRDIKNTLVTWYQKVWALLVWGHKKHLLIFEHKLLVSKSSVMWYRIEIQKNVTHKFWQVPKWLKRMPGFE